MISLLIIAHEQQDTLARHLPTLLAMQGTEFEVVVVDMNSEDGTIDLLDSMEELHPNFHHLSLPTSARDISRERLALHLGMRATNSSKVLVIPPGIEVPNENWLAEIESRWRPDCRIMLIPTKRMRSKGLGDYFTAGHEAWRNAMDYRLATGHSVFRAGTFILGLDKEIFLTYNSPAHHLALKTGTLDIFVSHASTLYNTIVIGEDELFPTDDSINNSRAWKQRRLFDVETRRHLTCKFKRHFTYLIHFLCTLHKGSVPYAIMDLYDYMRWCFTSKKTFIKKHY